MSEDSKTSNESKNNTIEEEWGDPEISLVLKEASEIWRRNVDYRDELNVWCLEHVGDFMEYVGVEVRRSLDLIVRLILL